MILDLPGDARVVEQRIEHLFEWSVLDDDMHVGERPFAERGFVGEDHSCLLGECRDHFAQRCAAERQVQVETLVGE